MVRKFEFTGEVKKISPTLKVERIRALIDIPRSNVTAGQLGGWLQYESNLSHVGDAWVANEAIVIGRLTTVSSDALIEDEARIQLDCQITDETRVSGKAKLTRVKLRGNQNHIGGNAIVKDVSIYGNDIYITEQAQVENVEFDKKSTSVVINGHAIMKNDWERTHVLGRSIVIKEHAVVRDIKKISGQNILIAGHARITEGVSVVGNEIYIQDNAELKGNIIIGNNVDLSELVSIYHDEIDDVHLKDVSLNGDLQLSVEALQKE